MSPETLGDDLRRLASNYQWTWAPSCRRLLQSLPTAAPGAHPAGAVALLEQAQLEQLAADPSFVARVADETGALEALLEGTPPPRIAYCSPEFGLSATFPQYAGGLGVLGGDHLKSASDLGLPLAGVGLFYGEGVFRQVIVDGGQSETYRESNPPLVGATDTGVTVQVPMPGRDVAARVWRLDVGRVPLALLDTDVDANTEEDRRITDRLYAGQRQHRLEQEMVLGVGGARALAALGWEVELHHLNEGHAGFIVLELLDRALAGSSWDDALAELRRGLVFTTHTPVPAGIDRFDADLIGPYLDIWSRRWGFPTEQLWGLGVDPEEPDKFNMAALCLRTSRSANGVSELHGEVSRKLFAGIGVGDEIGFVTNGVHARTWTGDHLQELFDDTLGQAWAAGDHAAWQRVSAIDDQRLVEARKQSSRLLADLVEAQTGDIVDPNALIVGFARRFAPYKRATLLLSRPELLGELLADERRPVHFVFAGKAHPLDDAGKSLVAEVIEAASSEVANGRITFVPDYDMDVAHAMVQGADVWLNNPIRPREASGTSGEKAVLNGALNCSILDGWWAEMYDGENGWEIPASSAHDPEVKNIEEATAMLETIAMIASEYHTAEHVFSGRIRHAWMTLGPRVTSARMLRDYQERVYRLE